MLVALRSHCSVQVLLLALREVNRWTVSRKTCVVPELFFMFGQPTLLQRGLIVELDFA